LRRWRTQENVERRRVLTTPPGETAEVLLSNDGDAEAAPRHEVTIECPFGESPPGSEI
jgi:hypothetical protein